MGQPGPSLAIDHVSFSYRRAHEELFGGLSHAFAPGATTAVTGESGRGKSTLLYLLGLLLRPIRGAVLIDGVAASTLPDKARSTLRAKTIGFVFQDAALDPSRTILDAVIEPSLYRGRGRNEVAQRAADLLGQLGVSERISHRPGQISGGQAQRVALCRCLLGDPGIILADEPTGNLDEHNSAAVLGILAEQARTGRTVVIATHGPAVVRACDDVLVLT